MSRTATRLDMSMMYAVHDALRRDLRQIGRIASQRDDDPVRLLRAGLGWQIFSKFLGIHHSAEDASIWPVVRVSAADQAEALGILDEMEAEHSAIDPMLILVNQALHDPDYGHERLGDLVDALSSLLTTHLGHEEARALPLIDATMTPEQWKHFGEDHRNRVGADARQYLPWLLDGAAPADAEGFLEHMPPPLVSAYRDEWEASFRELNRWEPVNS